VARIAYLSSDVIISVQPALSVESEFSQYLKQYQTNNASRAIASGVPEVRSLGSPSIPQG